LGQRGSVVALVQGKRARVRWVLRGKRDCPTRQKEKHENGGKRRGETYGAVKARKSTKFHTDESQPNKIIERFH